MRQFVGWMVLCLVLLAVVPLNYAQESDTCSAFVESAIDAAQENCRSLRRNEACYGYNSIRAAFYDENAALTFNNPTDRVPVDSLRSIEALPANPATGDMGIAVMKLQAMLPDTLPGQNVVLVLVGDVQLESDIAPTESVQPAAPVTLTLAQAADVHSGPGVAYNVIAGLPAGNVIEADAVSADSLWVRVVVDDYPRWVLRERIVPAAELDTLPAVTGQSYGTMQAFTFKTGIGESNCEDAPSSLMVQGPEGIEITLNVNGADITIASTVLFESLPGDELQISVLDGLARLSDRQVVMSGFRARIALDPRTRRIIGRWRQTEAMDARDLRRLRFYTRINRRLANYDVQAPRIEIIRRLVRSGALDFQNDYDGRPLLALRELLRNEDINFRELREARRNAGN